MSALPTTKWDVAAEELCRVREEIKKLKAREQDIVDVFKGYGAGVYAGSRYSIIVSNYSRAVVDIDGLRDTNPNLVEEFTEYRTYSAVKAAPITVVP